MNTVNALDETPQVEETLLVSPQMACVDNAWAPAPPEDLSQSGVDTDAICDLALKMASTVPRLTTEWAAQNLCLPVQIVEEVFWQFKKDQLVEIQGQLGPFNYQYAITQRGNDRAARLFEICGYVGPAPVSLNAYATMLEWDRQRRQEVTLERVRDALTPLTIPETIVQVAALAAASGRSLFLFGPAGNGKTTLGRLLHRVQDGELWIPHAIAVGSNVIRLFDPECHKVSEDDITGNYDRRWVRIRRPFIVAGGEMTIDELDLAYSPSHRFYEAPPHVKANGGTFLIDDFGRQRVEPQQLLNRWIVPLEHQTDHLTLHTGQKIQMPFRLMLTVATNLDVNDVADPAFLRRMGYRVRLNAPDEVSYRRIFQSYAEQAGRSPTQELLDSIIQRYESEGRELRSSEPRELIERCRDICNLHDKPLELSKETLDLAWIAFFGNQ